jgi:cell division protein ZapA
MEAGICLEKKKVEVLIGGEIITLMSAEHEDYITRLARYTDRKINEIKAVKSNAMIHERTRTVLIAINLADDYFKEHEKVLEIETLLKKYNNDIAEMEEENRLLQESVMELQGQLEQARRELEEYIVNFDNDTNVVAMPQRAASGFR